MLDLTCAHPVSMATAIDHSSEVITVTDTNGVMKYVNPAFEFVTGYTREEAIGQKPSLLSSGQHGKEHYRDLWRTISSGEVWVGRFLNKRKDGFLWEAESTIAPVKGPDGEISEFVEVKRDITEEVTLRTQLKHAKKVAGDIAHDFNNLLAIINGFSHLLISDLPAGNSNRDVMIQAIERAGDCGAALTKRLLAFDSARDGSRNSPLWT